MVRLYLGDGGVRQKGAEEGGVREEELAYTVLFRRVYVPARALTISEGLTILSEFGGGVLRWGLERGNLRRRRIAEGRGQVFFIKWQMSAATGR